jgi:hypothetical protein
MLIQEAQRNLMDVVGGCVAARWTVSLHGTTVVVRLAELAN